MRVILNAFFLLSVLLAFSACKNRNPDPSFADLQTFVHPLYDSDAECESARRQTKFLNCDEMVTFYPDGRADVLLGGGDIMYRSTYRRKGNKITIGEAAGIPKKIVFSVINEGQLRRIDNDSEWKVR
jgi:hypothetical protein